MSATSLAYEFWHRIRFRPLIQDVMRRGARRPRALVYYKTDGYSSFSARRRFSHTNTNEIFHIVSALDRFGFTVDLVDRTATWEEISTLKGHAYAFYLGNAAGNSAPFHSKILKEFRIQTKVLYAAGPEPELSNRLVNEQHLKFEVRTGTKCVYKRLVRGGPFTDRFEGLSAIFHIGNSFCAESYSGFGVPTFGILPSSSPAIRFEAGRLNERSPKRFVYFGGNGLICKGLDLVLETFAELPDFTLDVCAPREDAFYQHYAPLLARSPHIKVHDFIQVGSPLFNDIMARAAFILFPSAAEASATSVTTCMRAGVIPVVNQEVGLDIGTFGHLITDRSVPALVALVKKLGDTPAAEVQRRSCETYLASSLYTNEGFVRSFERALVLTLLAQGQLSVGAPIPTDSQRNDEHNQQRQERR